MYRTVIAMVSLYALVSAASLRAAPLWSLQHQLPTQLNASTTAPAGERGLCVVGSSLEIMSGGKWYPGSVRQAPNSLGTCLVSYDGYGPNWDEWVKLDRLRPRAAGSSVHRKQSETPAAKPGTLPLGRYACYTFDAGQLNYTYTDLVIQSATRYSVGSAKGSYQHAVDGSLIFKGGPLKDVAGSYSRKDNDSVEIKLVFYNTTRASMSCSQSGSR